MAAESVEVVNEIKFNQYFGVKKCYISQKKASNAAASSQSFNAGGGGLGLGGSASSANAASQSFNAGGLGGGLSASCKQIY